MIKSYPARKFLALMIDYVVLIASLYVIGNIIMGTALGIWDGIQEGLGNTVNDAPLEKMLDQGANYIIALIAFVYYGHPLKRIGQTIGEKVMKIKIVPSYTERIGLLAGIIRLLCLAPLLALIGLIPVSKDPYKSLLDSVCMMQTEDA